MLGDLRKTACVILAWCVTGYLLQQLCTDTPLSRAMDTVLEVARKAWVLV